MSGLGAVVVIPARDEERRIGACLRALGAQRGLTPRAFEVVLVLDRTRDATADQARAAARAAGLDLTVLVANAPGVGAARRQGMDLACERLESAGAAGGLVACTDADTEVDPHWLATQLALAEQGADAIGGRIDLHPGEAAALPPGTLALRDARARIRLGAVLSHDPTAEHHFFSGASLSVTARTYRACGGMPPEPALEDEAFARLLASRRRRIVRSNAVRVRTSARTHGRAPRGLAQDLRLAAWLRERRHDGRAYCVDALLGAKDGRTISVILPARDCADTIGEVLDVVVMPLAAAGLVDEVLVVDGRSTDATIETARRAGARVARQDDLLIEHGPALGKGDAMWRGLSATSGDVVAFLDADTADPRPVHLLGLLGPLLEDPGIAFVKGAFARPFKHGDEARAGEGGRVTELMARPLLNLYAPDLAGFEQPLAGEIAARRELLEALPFPVGYGVEIAMLMDALAHAGLDGLTESWLGTRQNRHQPLRDLSAMAYAVLAAVHARVHPGSDLIPAGLVQPWDGGAVRDVPVLERAPLADQRSGASAAASAARVSTPSLR